MESPLIFLPMKMTITIMWFLEKKKKIEYHALRNEGLRILFIRTLYMISDHLSKIIIIMF